MRVTRFFALLVVLVLSSGCSTGDDAGSDPSADAGASDAGADADSEQEAPSTEDAGPNSDSDGLNPIDAAETRDAADSADAAPLTDAVDTADAVDTEDAVDAADAVDTADSGADLPEGCGAGLEACGDDCVLLTVDRQHCGFCDYACDASEDCRTGLCEPARDCRETACDAGYFCNLADGRCLRGCLQSDECGTHERCDTSSRSCVCVDDHHACGGACVSDDLAAHCGARCEACPGSSSGQAVCLAESCGLVCDAGHRLCDGACARCPSDAAVSSTTCAGAACVASACDDGFRLCDGACARCPEDPGIAAVTCAAGECVAASCESEFHMCVSGCERDDDADACGPDCVVCPEPADPTLQAACGSGACTVECAPGLSLCKGVCAAGPCAWSVRQLVQFQDGPSTRVAVAVDDLGDVHVAYTTRSGLVDTLNYVNPDEPGSHEPLYAGCGPAIALSAAGSVTAVCADDNRYRVYELEGESWHDRSFDSLLGDVYDGYLLYLEGDTLIGAPSRSAPALRAVEPSFLDGETWLPEAGFSVYSAYGFAMGLLRPGSAAQFVMDVRESGELVGFTVRQRGAAGSWFVAQTVDLPFDYAVVARDADGLVATFTRDGAILYASEANDWEPEVVAAAYHVRSNVSPLWAYLDANDVPHVVYRTSASSMSLATRLGGHWLVETIATDADEDWHWHHDLDIALDGAGQPVLALIKSNPFGGVWLLR